ncbi:hypothetical protein BSKO_02321 [Bryopsis sp. KO-2023]|nr:hypothetical protein BSKO_02321 [Bryopsis sp. KO-2023]
MMNLHILPPLPFTEAVWTAPFFLSGNQVPTLSARFGPLYVRTNAQEVSFVGPYNSVGSLLVGEREACKGFVYIVDGVFSSVDPSRL